MEARLGDPGCAPRVILSRPNNTKAATQKRSAVVCLASEGRSAGLDWRRPAYHAALGNGSLESGFGLAPISNSFGGRPGFTPATRMQTALTFGLDSSADQEEGGP